MRVLRTEARRRISILIAEKSMRRKFIGAMASAMGAIPVGRALDLTKPGSGKIYLPDPDKEPLLIRGADTHFDTETVVNGLLVLPVVNANAASAEIAEIISATEIRLKREFKGDDALEQLTGKRTVEGKATGYGGIKYKVAPKVDQTKVYDAVFDRLNHNGAVCIFPEGGSHDRTELLPLKPGVAIMALGSLAANPDSGLKIVPCGMNYFHAHKFRSRAVVEFGSPIEVPKELVDMYKAGERREATRQLLEIVYQALVSVTLTSPDYDTLMVRQLSLFTSCG
jgi:glycerol-3-phosphate O-acyltransferase/dihydroxyacetone phosphate acyltransferase